MQPNSEKALKAWHEQASLSMASGAFLPFLDYTGARLTTCAAETLSTVFLDALLERVLFETSEKYTFLKVIRIKNGAFDFSELRKTHQSLSADLLHEGGTVLIQSTLLLIYKLTDGLLSQTLYDELAFITFGEMNTKLILNHEAKNE